MTQSDHTPLNCATAETQNPWQTTDSRKVYDNPWISVREDRVINPAGGAGIYGVVQFKSLAIGIIPIDENLNTWLVGQYRYATKSYSWELPMGGSPLSQDPLAGAKRELQEETGLSASHWQHLMQLHTSNSVCDERGHVYIATDLQQGSCAPDDTEQLAIQRLPLQSVFEMVARGEISDCISIAALMRLQVDLLKGKFQLPGDRT